MCKCWQYIEICLTAEIKRTIVIGWPGAKCECWVHWKYPNNVADKITVLSKSDHIHMCGFKQCIFLSILRACEQLLYTEFSTWATKWSNNNWPTHASSHVDRADYMGQPHKLYAWDTNAYTHSSTQQRQTKIVMNAGRRLASFIFEWMCYTKAH